MNGDPILADLNPEQVDAVISTEGPLLVLAGAGSGKTRVITRRIAYLIGRLDVKPWQILAVTFTNKAAEEMRRRVEALLERDGLSVWMGTFHATAARILRKHAPQLGFTNSFLIHDESDQLALIKECLRELDLSERTLHPKAIAFRIGRAKAELQGPAEYALSVTDYVEEQTARVYRLYQEKLRRSNAMDFDDLLMAASLLFEERSDILRLYQDFWRYILVDEYQDTNQAQYRLVRLLAQAHRNLCVVGDDDQSIYGFRGANLSNILDFERDYPGCTVIRLEQNYRSTQRILNAASHVIAHNRGRKGKQLWTANEGGERIVLYQARDEEEEAAFIAEAIESLALREGRSFDDFAIFYRTNAQSRALEEACGRKFIPYVVVGGLRFYERKEVKDLLAYLRFILNPHDSVSLRRIINVPHRGIGEGTVEKLEGLAQAAGISLWEACGRAVEEKLLPGRQRRSLERLYHLIERYRSQGFPSVPDLLLDLLKETGYIDSLIAQGTPEALGRLENLKELVVAAQAFHERSEEKSLQAFLDGVALMAGIDEFREGRGAVALMTLHMAKGLEFPVVFISGMEEGLFPHAWALTDDSELEEERRLFYVGMTRAKERLYLTAALKRQLRGQGFGLPSRFLEEIPPDLLEVKGSGAGGHGSVGESVRELSAVSFQQPEPFVDNLRVGMKVRHPEWGVGVVKERIGSGQGLKVVVSFQRVGRKRLAAKHANLEPFLG